MDIYFYIYIDITLSIINMFFYNDKQHWKSWIYINLS